jgi:hypothetical protein
VCDVSSVFLTVIEHHRKEKCIYVGEKKREEEEKKRKLSTLVPRFFCPDVILPKKRKETEL